MTKTVLYERNLGFSFTGKERDSETGYSYFGARYYDSDLSGLFLSIDPIAEVSSFEKRSGLLRTSSSLRAPQELVPYCAWNPFKLVDPGGEDPVKPLIRYGGYGSFYVNIDNLWNTTRKRLTMANENPQNWPANSIGINLQVGQLSCGNQVARSYSTVGIRPEHTSTRIEPPIAKTTGLSDRRFSSNRRLLTGPSTGAGGKALGIFSLGVNLVNYSASFYQSWSIYKDNKELQRQQGVLNDAVNIVNQAINDNMLPTDFYSDINLAGSLVNYIFQGENMSGDARVSFWGDELYLYPN